MSKPNYRVTLTFDGERKLFVARAPELEHCTGEGPSRAEAIARVEEEIDAQLANMLSHGATPPRAADEEVWSGELACKVSKTLHRELTYQARSEGIDLDHMLGELIAAALESRKHAHRAHRGGNRQPQEHVPHDNIGNRHDGNAGPRRQGGFGGGRQNYQLLDDRANFIEYVRGLEQQGQRGPGPGQGGGGRRRRGRGGGGGGNGRPMHDHNRHGGQGFQGNRNGQPNAQGSAAPAPAAPPPASSSGDPEGNT
jgi:predicted RNase H-like HicB family nuclease